MKKIYPLLLMAFVFSTTATYAQTAKKTEFSVQAGYNLATGASKGQRGAFRHGLNFGMGVEYFFSEEWSIKGAALYDQKGWTKNSLTFANGTLVTDFNLNYLTIPVLAGIQTGNKTSFFVHAGPYVSFLLNASLPGVTGDTKQLFNGTDTGLYTDLGVKFPVSLKTKLSLSLSSQLGAVTVNNTRVLSLPGLNPKNRTLSFNLGLHF